MLSPSVGKASYPTSVTAALIAAISTTPGKYSIEAFSAAKLTSAFNTPGRPFNASSILLTQDAQLIPRIANVAVSGATSYPASATARTSWPGVVRVESKRTDACSVARLT